MLARVREQQRAETSREHWDIELIVQNDVNAGVVYL